MLVNLELRIDYTKLFYRSGNGNKAPFNFYEFGSIEYRSSWRVLLKSKE